MPSFNQDLEGHFNTLQAAAPAGAEVALTSRSRDEKTWVVSYRRDDGPTEFVVYDVTSGAITPLFVSQVSVGVALLLMSFSIVCRPLSCLRFVFARMTVHLTWSSLVVSLS